MLNIFKSTALTTILVFGFSAPSFAENLDLSSMKTADLLLTSAQSEEVKLCRFGIRCSDHFNKKSYKKIT